MRQLGAAGPGCPRQESPALWRSFYPLCRRAGSIAPPLGPHRGGLCLVPEDFRKFEEKSPVGSREAKILRFRGYPPPDPRIPIDKSER